jgi:alkylhydroperoxidase family enzyme
VPRIDIPPSERNIRSYFGSLAPAVWEAKERFHDAVYEHTSLPIREAEAARMRVAQINGCLACQAGRIPRDRPRAGRDQELPEAFYADIAEWRTAGGFTVRERLAIEFAERTAIDHESLAEDDAFWAELHARFRDDELVDLGLTVASSLAGGRIAHVFGIDVCDVHGRPLQPAR